MSSDLDLSQELTAIVAATPGVTTVYASGSPIRAMLRTVADAVSHDADDAGKIAVTRDHDGALAVSVIIGVDAGTPVPATMRRVGDAVREFLLAQPGAAPTIGRIDVQASRIEEPDETPSH